MQTISLKCSNCGANLDIRPEVKNLGCGYCGASLTVQREGGSVYLTQIAEGISAVRTGTDKTAAELSMQRLEREADAINQTYVGLLTEANRRKSSSASIAMAAVIIGCVITICNFSDKLTTYSGGSLLMIFGAILGIPVVLWFLNSSDVDRKLAESSKPLKAEYDRIQTEIGKKREIANQ